MMYIDQKMKNNQLLLCFCMFLSFQGLQAQIGGKHHYEFLNLPNSARITALGGYLNTVKDDDVTLALTNPAALNETMGGAIAFHHNFYLSDIQNGYVAYGHHLENSGYTLHAGVRYISYGDFMETNDIGDVTGSFDANETAVVAGVGKSMRITV